MFRPRHAPPEIDPHLHRHFTAQTAGEFAPGFQPPAYTSPLLDPFTPLAPPTTMHPHHHQFRAQLGLAVHGPFSRNRKRRRTLRDAAPVLLVSSLLLSLLIFLTAIFS